MLESLVWAAVVTLAAMPFLLLMRARGGGSHGPAAGEGVWDGPCHHSVPRDVAEFVIPGFRPGFDTCAVELTDPGAEFDAVVDADGVRFLFLDGGSYLEVAFPGLKRPPFADTEVYGPGPAAAGTQLSALVGDTACAQSAKRFHRVRTEIAAFQWFNAQREVLEVWVPPETAVLPRIDVRPTADGADGEVVIDGRTAARLRGAPHAGRDNVRIVRKWPDGPKEDVRISA